MRIELTLGYQYAPQTYASTNSATRAAIQLRCLFYDKKHSKDKNIILYLSLGSLYKMYLRVK